MNIARKHIAPCRMLAILVGLALFAGCNSESATSTSTPSTTTKTERILNGTPQTEIGTPQLVRVVVQYADGTTGLCSGAVVGSGAVLTAAHCSTGATAVEVQTDAAHVAASDLVVAPGYSIEDKVRAIFSDIAVVHAAGLDLPALPILASMPVTSGEPLAVYGYGLDQDGVSGELRGGETSISVVTPNHIFGAPFSGDGVNPCNGDSGAPALQTVTLPSGEVITGIVGVVSSGTIAGCAKGDTTLYTNLQQPELLSFLAEEVPDLVVR